MSVSEVRYGSRADLPPLARGIARGAAEPLDRVRPMAATVAAAGAIAPPALAYALPTAPALANRVQEELRGLEVTVPLVEPDVWSRARPRSPHAVRLAPRPRRSPPSRVA